MNDGTIEVNEFQGIDLDKIELVLNRLKYDPQAVTRSNIDEIAGDLLELCEHVREDGLLTRIAAARKEMAEEILPSIH